MMDRKQFISISLKAPLSALALTSVLPMCCVAAAANGSGAGTATERQQAFAQKWVRLLAETVDAQLDAPTRMKLMRTMGRGCFTFRHGERNQAGAPEDKEKFLADLRGWVGKEGLRVKGNVIDFEYPVKRVGGCLCPLVAKAAARLPASYCQCSAGYVQEMFARHSKGAVKVDLVESLNGGGQSCRFRIELEA